MAWCDSKGLVSPSRIAHQAQRDGIDEVHVTARQLGEGRLGTPLGVGAQQLRVGLIVHSQYGSRRRQNRTGKGRDLPYHAHPPRRGESHTAIGLFEWHILDTCCTYDQAKVFSFIHRRTFLGNHPVSTQMDVGEIVGW